MIRERNPDIDLRLECLKLCDGDVTRAQEAYAFITDARPSSPMERAGGALRQLHEAVEALRHA